MPTQAEIEARIGRAINKALYNTPYDGKLNIPCLSKEQEMTAGKAALEAAERASKDMMPWLIIDTENSLD